MNMLTFSWCRLKSCTLFVPPFLPYDLSCFLSNLTVSDISQRIANFIWKILIMKWHFWVIFNVFLTISSEANYLLVTSSCMLLLFMVKVLAFMDYLPRLLSTFSLICGSFTVRGIFSKKIKNCSFWLLTLVSLPLLYICCSFESLVLSSSDAKIAFCRYWLFYCFCMSVVFQDILVLPLCCTSKHQLFHAG